MNKEKFFQLIEKYHSPAGRYNYYPRISQWKNNSTVEQWYSEVSDYSGDLDLYIHIPFCEKFCHFCGCNVKIAQKDDAKNLYIEKLIHEWTTYKKDPRDIKNIFIGGGTPNSLTLSQFKKLFDGLGLKNESKITLSIEADPREINIEKFLFLKSYGLSSVSLGLQDVDKDVLNIIGRPTDLETVKDSINFLSTLDLENLSLDMLYGLPKQGELSLTKFKGLLEEIEITAISLYPFANVPWFQDFYPLWEESKPSVQRKYEHYFELSSLLENNGFKTISFGHFFKSDSKFYKAFVENKLTRSIMGHSINKSPVLLGLGVSAISSGPKSLKQNEKIYENYLFQDIGAQSIHTKGQSEENLEDFFISLSSKTMFTTNLQIDDELISDGIITKENDNYRVTDLGRHFVQHIAKSIEKNIL